MAKRVFISYRRDDTGPVARLVYDRLWRVLSKTNVFFDVSTIGGGEDFRQKIAAEINRSDAALILIGAQWLKETPSRQTRIWEPDDYVRTEVREALARSILVVPILVSGADMPKAELLPDDVRPITTKNGLPLRHDSFEDDMEKILATILGERVRERHWEKRASIVTRIAHGIGGAVVAALIMVAIALLHFWIFDRPLAESVGTPLTVLMITTSIIVGVWVGLSRAKRMSIKR